MALERATRGHARIDKQGRIIIPVELRRELGFEPGQVLSLEVSEGELRVVSLDEAIKRLQSFMKIYTAGRTGLVDQFIADKRREAERE